jgi:hypothetical protein
MKTYNANYFISKFTPIPSSRWCTGQLTWGDPAEKMCALGHLGSPVCVPGRDGSVAKTPDRALAFERLIMDNFGVHAYQINDGIESVVEGLGLVNVKNPKNQTLSALAIIAEKESRFQAFLGKLTAFFD